MTWLWTVNIIDKRSTAGFPPRAPGGLASSYVTWVGIDGYYLKPSWQFAPLFGPTIVAVRAADPRPDPHRRDGRGACAGQPAKIADLFAGIRAYGLLGFVWFDSTSVQNFRIDRPLPRRRVPAGGKSLQARCHDGSLRLTVLGTGYLGITHAACMASLGFERPRRRHRPGGKWTS